MLSNAYAYFPPGTIHVAVVDPGVGSARKAILVKGGKFFFVGPDNGIFGLVLNQLKHYTVFELIRSRFFLNPVSATFHGRDIFAPIAAHLSRGVSPLKMGKEIKRFARLSLPPPSATNEAVKGQVVYIDGFGNVITNIFPRLLKSIGEKSVIRIGNTTIAGIAQNYHQAKKGTLLALWGSSGFLEIAVCEGSAKKKLTVKPGDMVAVSRKNKPS